MGICAFIRFRPMLVLILFLLMMGYLRVPVWAADELHPVYDINTRLMETTFRIEGITKDNHSTIGTAFLIGKPIKDQPELSRYVLVTAAHVLEGMAQDIAILHLRTMTDAKEWKRAPFRLQVRKNGQPLWTKHPDADVAAMYVALPNSATSPIAKFAGASLLADDDILRLYEIHPGDTLYCLGFPLGYESNSDGFPILRSGKIASYPLLPTQKTKTFLLDFPVFFGNSGGPVYFIDNHRIYGQTVHLGEVNQFLVGLVSHLRRHPEHVKELSGERLQYYPLGLAEVVHARLIKETLALLP